MNRQGLTNHYKWVFWNITLILKSTSKIFWCKILSSGSANVLGGNWDLYLLRLKFKIWDIWSWGLGGRTQLTPIWRINTGALLCARNRVLHRCLILLILGWEVEPNLIIILSPVSCLRRNWEWWIKMLRQSHITEKWNLDFTFSMDWLNNNN